MKLCECGCKILIPEINKKGKSAKFFHGHNNRGIKWSKKTRYKVSISLKEWYRKTATKVELEKRYKKISQSNLGKSPSSSSFKKGHIPWTKGRIGFLAEEKNPNWQGGKAFMNGYWFIRIAKGKYVKRSRIVMEKHLDKKLSPHDIIHHINGDKTDDRIENLQLMTRKEHINLHHH